MNWMVRCFDGVHALCLFLLPAALQSDMESVHVCSTDGYGGWSEAGCYRVDTPDTDDEVVCRCNHLSNFAVLLVSSAARSALCFQCLSVIF